MKAMPLPDPRCIRIDLTLPVTRIGFGPFSFDPVEQLVGAPFAEILESLLVGPVNRRPSPSGPAVDVYPLALPDGEGASIPLGALGEVGFANEGGLLVLTVPLPMRSWVADRLGGAVLRSEERLSDDGTCRIARFRIRVTPGVRAVLPIGSVGQIGIEAR